MNQWTDPHRSLFMDDILIVKDLVKHYPIRRGVVPRVVGRVRAVDGVSFSIPRGQTLGLVGESGCGKTTVGRTILRLIEPTSGRVVFDGREVFKLREREMRDLRREMQIIFQDPYGSLNPRMTVGAMLEEPILVHGIKRDASEAGDEGSNHAFNSRSSRFDSAGRRRAREHAAELLRLVGLGPETAARYAHEFSGGQRQRIGIARALALRPKLVVCDEAVSALDVSIQAQILNLLGELQQRFNLTYLFIAHDLAVVKHISDRIAVMYLGEIVEEAETEEIFARPAHPYTRALLASIPVPIPRASRERASLKGDAPTLLNPPEGCRFNARCPIAVEECKRDKPPFVEIGPGHRVACFRPELTTKGQ
jgi:oligopeptide/dipeptide ABC transporter ATP-binding protein